MVGHWSVTDPPIQIGSKDVNELMKNNVIGYGWRVVGQGEYGHCQDLRWMRNDFLDGWDA